MKNETSTEVLLRVLTLLLALTSVWARKSGKSSKSTSDEPSTEFDFSKGTCGVGYGSGTGRTCTTRGPGSSSNGSPSPPTPQTKRLCCPSDYPTMDPSVEVESVVVYSLEDDLGEVVCGNSDKCTGTKAGYQCEWTGPNNNDVRIRSLTCCKDTPTPAPGSPPSP